MPMFQNIKSNLEKQVNLLIIPNGEKWHYIAVKNTCIIKRNNFKTRGGILLLEFSSLF